MEGYKGDGFDCRESEETVGAGEGFKVINEHLAISCGKMLIRVVLDKRFLMGMMRRTDLRLNDARCLPKDNGTHFLFETNLTSCGTKMMATENAFVYMNTIQERPSEGIITRLAEVDIPFRCLYLKMGRASAIQLETRRKIIRANATDSGMFDINLGVFKDADYTRPYGDQSFPIGVMVNERVYLQLSVDSKDPRLAVMAQRCHATPDPNPNSSLQYDLILDGCPQDFTVQYHPTSVKGLHRFSLQAFHFINTPDPFVYIHCKAVVCNSSDPNSECLKDCNVLPRHRQRRALPYTEPLHVELLSHGPILLKNVQKPQEDSPDQDPLIGVSIVLGMLALLCFAMLTVVLRRVMTNKKQRTSDDV